MHRCLKLSHPAFETPAWIETRIWDEVAKQLATDWRERSQYRQPRAWRDWQKTGTKKLSRTWTQHSFICFATRGRGGVVGAGATGWLGIIASVEAARRHPEEMKAIVLMSGRAFRDGLQFLHQAAQLPQLFVFSSEDEYSPTEDAMKLLYPASSPGKKLVHHYSATEDASWLCYETSDAAKVPGHRGHGTDLFKVHPESPGIIVQRPERFGAEVRGKRISNADSHAALCHPGQTWSSGEGRFAAV